MEIFPYEIGPRPEPKPPSGRDIIADILLWKQLIEDRDPKNWIFVYHESYAPDHVMMVGPSAFYDRKRRVFLNPKHEPTISAWLAEQDV